MRLLLLVCIGRHSTGLIGIKRQNDKFQACIVLCGDARRFSGGTRHGPQVAHVFREGRKVEVEGGIDFTAAVFDEETGKRCILKEEQIDTVTKKPVMECTHK